MRRTLAWIVGLAGIAALGRWASRRRREHDAWSTDRGGEATTPDPADELRARLTEQREQAAAVPEAEGAATIEERRTRVHAQAQAAIDEMREPDA